MKFVADDGKIFDTMEECEEYEKMGGEGREIARLWDKYITMYDAEGNIKNPTVDWTNVSQFLHEVEELMLDYQGCNFIHIASDCKEWVKIRDFLYDEYGVILPDYGVGLWRYDNECEEWVSFKEEMEKLKENWAPMGIRF